MTLEIAIVEIEAVNVIALLDDPVVCGDPAEPVPEAVPEAELTGDKVEVTTAEVGEMLADAVPTSTVK